MSQLFTIYQCKSIDKMITSIRVSAANMSSFLSEKWTNMFPKRLQSIIFYRSKVDPMTDPKLTKIDRKGDIFNLNSSFAKKYQASGFLK